MANILPPRKNPTPKLSKQSPTPLQTLLQMGFNKNRAEKALAATGNRGSVQLASDWILSHVNDPYLDDNTPREYILYACPIGPLQSQLEAFWQKSRDICGWNGAHNFMPHITLVSFFKSTDESAPKLSKSLRNVVAQRGLQLELYSSPNFMGFFVGEDDANFLKRIALQFVKEVSDTIICDTYDQLDPLVACFPWCSGVSSNARCIPRSNRSISLDPHVRSLHLTLAYQFPSEQFNALKQLVETLDPKTETSWELRLYSRDQRLATRQVHKIIYPYAAPTEADELELRLGDYVYLNPDNLQTSDGWVEGISWLTGCTGYLPINYTERCPETEAWVLHKAVPLCEAHEENFAGEREEEDVESRRRMALENPSLEDVDSVTLQQSAEKPDPSEVYRLLSEKSISYDLNPEENRQKEMDSVNKNVTRVFVMRHGERVDFTFGNWLSYSLDEAGNYVQQDLNLPDQLPKRRDPQAWEKDSPLTRIGVYQAKLVGEALRRNGIQIDKAYASPAFRSVLTCASVLEGLQQKSEVPVNVDVGLFEWCMWHHCAGATSFDWLSRQELEEGGFNVNQEYAQRVSGKDLEANMEEAVEEYYHRSGVAVEDIVKGAAGQNILIVGHASTLEVVHRKLTEGPVRSTVEFNRLMQKIPYCGMVGLERDLTKGSHWTVMEEGGKYSVTHSANQRFDSSVLVANK